MSPKAVFFDLDGTLVDNFTAVHKCCNLVEQDLGLPLTDYAKVRSIVGGSIVLTMQRLVREEFVPKAIDLYRGYFSEYWAEGLFVMPGAEWLLGALQGRGIRTAVLTNKNEASSVKIIKHLGLLPLVCDVIGTREGDAARGLRKPFPAFANMAMERLGCEASATMMVGDSPFDAQTGLGVGMTVHLVATGTHSAAELAECGATGIHKDMFALGESVFGFVRK
jgi:phosphoglycolate phosphatase